MAAFAVAAPSAYWYVTRGTGTVTLVLLTLSVALGVANVRRVRTDRVPRFVLDAVHRNVSLLAMAFLLVHILTSLLDGFAPVRLLDVIIPFGSPYRPLWLGFGTVAFDLLLAVMITSLLRRRFGYRAWRRVHWGAYASWPVALLHGVGTGSDAKAGWMLVILAGCLIMMIVAVVARATAGWPHHAGPRLAALAASALVPLGLVVWLPSGPLAAGWARRAGTPASLLRMSTSPSSTTATTSPAPATRSFTTSATGTTAQGSTGDDLSGVDISLSLAGQRLNKLAIHLRGQPLDDGGIQMTSSDVTLGPASDPAQYRGRVTSLAGPTISAALSAANGSHLSLVAHLQISSENGTASGTVSVAP